MIKHFCSDFITQMSSVPVFPKLFKKNNNKIYEWSIILDVKDTIIDIHTIYGYVGGSLITKTKTLEKGKANRSLLQQATLEAQSKWIDKKEKELYVEVLDETPVVRVRPMLAQTFSLKKKYVFPLFVQRKYDGIRCIAYLDKDKNVVLESRNGVPFYNFDLLKEQVRVLLIEHPTLYLDGELYTNQIPFETLSGLIRSKSSVDNYQIQYHIYDYYNTENTMEPYHSRVIRLNEMFSNANANANANVIGLLREVKTEIVKSIEDIYRFHTLYIQEGFEGIMIRHPEGVYEIDKRSKYLCKYKEFVEEEFEIVGFHEGTAGEKGCVIWDCLTRDGKSFAVRPRGTFEQRKEWFQSADTYLGKQLTVVFQEYSQEGIPRFPVGKAIRENY